MIEVDRTVFTVTAADFAPFEALPWVGSTMVAVRDGKLVVVIRARDGCWHAAQLPQGESDISAVLGRVQAWGATRYDAQGEPLPGLKRSFTDYPAVSEIADTNAAEEPFGSPQTLSVSGERD